MKDACHIRAQQGIAIMQPGVAEPAPFVQALPRAMRSLLPPWSPARIRL